MATAQKSRANSRMKTEPLSPMDVAWRDFVQKLPAWQYHLLLKGETEMILHDDFVSGYRSLEEIRLALSYEPTHDGCD